MALKQYFLLPRKYRKISQLTAKLLPPRNNLKLKLKDGLPKIAHT